MKKYEELVQTLFEVATDLNNMNDINLEKEQLIIRCENLSESYESLKEEHLVLLKKHSELIKDFKQQEMVLRMTRSD